MKRLALSALILLAGCDRHAEQAAQVANNTSADMSRTLLTVRWTGGGFTREYPNLTRCEQARDTINNDSAARLTYAEIAYRDDHEQPATKILTYAVALCVPA
jgi:hypothetical protein